MDWTRAIKREMAGRSLMMGGGHSVNGVCGRRDAREGN
jgi:hypothetical protein